MGKAKGLRLSRFIKAVLMVFWCACGCARCFEKGAKFPVAARAQTEGRAVALCRR